MIGSRPWLADDLPMRFEGRSLDIDHRTAEVWGIVMARSHKASTTLGTLDGFLAATAEAHGLTLVTRNVGDFSKLGIRLFDPWRPGR